MDPNEKITEPQISKLKELGLTDEQIAAIPNRGKAQAKILELTRPKPTAENMAAMRARKQNIHAKTEEQKLNEQERLKAEAERKARLESTRKPKPKPGDDDFDEDEEGDDFNEEEIDDESDDFDSDPTDDE